VEQEKIKDIENAILYLANYRNSTSDKKEFRDAIISKQTLTYAYCFAKAINLNLYETIDAQPSGDGGLFFNFYKGKNSKGIFLTKDNEAYLVTRTDGLQVIYDLKYDISNKESMGNLITLIENKLKNISEKSWKQPTFERSSTSFTEMILLEKSAFSCEKKKQTYLSIPQLASAKINKNIPKKTKEKLYASSLLKERKFYKHQYGTLRSRSQNTSYLATA